MCAAVGFFVCNANRGDNGDTVSLSNAHRDSLGGNAGLCPRTTQTNETRVTTRRDIASTDNAPQNPHRSKAVYSIYGVPTATPVRLCGQSHPRSATPPL